MKVRKYLQNVLRINAEVIPNLPPFHCHQEIDDEGIMDILLYGTPKLWHQEMEHQGFDPMSENIQDTMEMMERIEATKDFDGKAQKPKPKPNKKSKDN